MRLRTGMLEVFETQILVERLTTGIKKIESTAYGKQFSPLVDEIEHMSIQDIKAEFNCDEATAKEMNAKIYAAFADYFGKLIANRDTSMTMGQVEEVDKKLRKENRVMLNTEEKQTLALKFLAMDKELAQTEADIRRGNDERYQRLLVRQDRETSKASKKYFLRDIMKAFLAPYDKAKITLNSWRAVDRQTKFILKYLGNIEFTELNSKASTDKLKAALKNKKKSNGEDISPTERSSYVKRLKSVVAFAIEEYELDAVNRIKDKKDRFVKPVDTCKLAFSFSEMKKFEEALCVAPMVFGKGVKPRNDRFWILLIALLHGFRKTSIVNLHGRHIIDDAQTKIPCFDLTNDWELLLTKTDNMRALVPIHPMLIDLGFKDWLDTRGVKGDTKIFEDTPEGFGQWFNGLNPTSGWNYDYITQEDRKTFHSFRHNFCDCMEELDVTEKMKNEMSGHANKFKGDDVRRKYYLSRVRVKSMYDVFQKSIEQGKILMTDLDWDRLKKRADELFFQCKDT